MRWKQITVVVSLAVTALLFGNGCLQNWMVDESARRRITELYLPYVFKCVPSDPFDGSLQVYEVQPDGSLKRRSDSPLDGEDCDESEGDPARPSTMSTPVTSSSSTTTTSAGRREAGASRGAHQDWYGALSPIPGMPYYPATTPVTQQACTPGTSIYMINHRSSTVTRVETCPLKVGKRIQVGSNPLQLALTPDARTLVVTRYDSRVVFIDTATDTVTANVNTPGLFPNGIAISPDGATAYVTNFNNANSQVFEINLATRQIGRSVSTQSFPKSVFLTPDGQQLWVNHYRNSTISIIDTLTMTITSQINTGGSADTGMAFNPTGTLAYIAVRPNALAVYDTATLQRVTTVPVEQWPTDVVFSPDGRLILVGSLLSNIVSVVDGRTNTLIRSASVDSAGGMGMMMFR